MGLTRRALTSAPWRRAPLLLWRDRILGTLVLAVAALAGFVAAASPLYASSVSVASFGQQLEPLCLGSSIYPSTRIPIGDAGPILERQVATHGDVFAAPIRSTVAAQDTGGAPPLLVLGEGGSGGTTPMAFATRTGFEQHLPGLASAAPSGLYLPTPLAEAAGVEAGDEVTMSGAEGKTVTMPVAGVFDDLVNHPRDPYWCPLQPAIQPQITDEFSPSPTAVVDDALFPYLVNELGLRLTFQSWEAPIAVDLTEREQARRAAEATEQLREETGPLRLSLTSRLPFVVDRAAAMRSSVSAGVTPVVVLALTAVGGLVAGTALFWATRRRTELRVLWSRGIPPWLLGVKAALELGPTILVGAVAGWALAWPLVRGFGPGTRIERSVPWTALATSLLAALLAVAVAAVVVALRSRLAPLPSSAHRRRRLPLWPILVLTLVWSWWRLSSLTLAVPNADELPPVPWETFVVPVVFLVSATSLAVLALRSILAAGASGARRLPTVAYLAVRRIAGASTIVLVLCAAAGLAMGVVTYGAGLAGSTDRTVDLKLRTGNGSDTDAYLLPPGMPPSLVGRATPVIARRGDYADEQVNVLAIEAATFADGAVWDASFADESLPSLLARLGPATEDGAVPAILVGGALPPTGELTFPLQNTARVPLDVVATAVAFPGYDGVRPLVVVDASAMTEWLGQDAPHLWTTASVDEVRQSGIDNRQRLVRASSAEGRIETSVFQPVVWIAQFVQAVGVLIAALAAGALLAYLGAGRRGRALAGELLRRMGLGARRQWLVAALELGLLALLALVTGIAAGWLSVLSLERLVDAAPSVPPAAVLQFPLTFVTWTAVAGLVLVLAGAAVATIAASRTSTAELLRDDL